MMCIKLMPAILVNLIIVVFATPSTSAQPLTLGNRLQGYSHEADTTYFIFDSAVYGVVPEDRVVVTGAFRNWDQDMSSRAWRLSQYRTEPGIWVLSFPNPDYRYIGPGVPFKFRIDDGRWLDPPGSAPNEVAGNLVFLYGIEPPHLEAERQGPRAILATLTGDAVDRPLDVSAYRIVDAHGAEISVATVLPNTASRTLVVPVANLDVRKVYYLEIPSMKLTALIRRDPWFKTLFSGKELGAIISEDGSKTIFRVFSPRADQVRLYLYKDADDKPEEAIKVIAMQRDRDGVWEAEASGDLSEMYYDYTVHGFDEPGNYFYEEYPVHVNDPYARVNVDAWGKSRVWRPTMPASPLRDGRPAMEDVIAYEVHIQDFTDLLPVSDDLKGTIPAMVMPGLRNSRGEKIGFDYLVDLDINVVHLMPIQEFLHYPDEEWQQAFQGDPYMIEHGISLENYQWGYRTTHAFAVETRYRRRGTEHGAQRDQFRDLVQAFHDVDIAVIIDLVPNHTGENMNERHHLLNFNVFDLPYYFRTDERLNHIGPFGNEIKSEERPMVQRWIIDQCKHFIDEFGIDGFRIDLAGQIDEQTLYAVRRELGEDVIIYGEAWIPPSDPEVAANPDWAWYKTDAPITYFQDDARNAFKGPVSNPQNKETDRGFAGGDASVREQVMMGLLNSFDEEVHPNRGINYLDIHDNWTLADRFAHNDWNGSLGVDEARFKIAAGLLFTSLGPIVLHGGTEMMRSKASAPLEEIVKEIPSGTLYFHGKRDTYNLRKPNQFMWEHVGQPRDNSESFNDYQNMLAYWKGLIALRKSNFGKVFRIGIKPPDGYYQWFLPENAHLLGYLVDERVLVLVNTDERDGTFEDVVLPDGTWRLVADHDRVDVVNGVSGTEIRLDIFLLNRTGGKGNTKKLLFS